MNAAQIPHSHHQQRDERSALRAIGQVQQGPAPCPGRVLCVTPAQRTSMLREPGRIQRPPEYVRARATGTSDSPSRLPASNVASWGRGLRFAHTAVNAHDKRETESPARNGRLPLPLSLAPLLELLELLAVLLIGHAFPFVHIPPMFVSPVPSATTDKVFGRRIMCG